MGRMIVCCAGLFAVLSAGLALAGEADVLRVNVERAKDAAQTYDFNVTVRHDDQGWAHYADRWQIVGPEGTVLATRVLQHPHVDEQPFTRSLAGVKIPDSVHRVTVRARDSKHGFGGKEESVELPR